MILDDLFQSLGDFSDFVPGVDSSFTLAQLASSAISAKKQITNIISTPVYEAIQTGTDEVLKGNLKAALGNLTMAKETIFDVVRKRKSDIDIYKNEQEALRKAYFDNYYNAMDSLISGLYSSQIAAWKETSYCKLLDKLQIKTTDDFNLYYPIDNSYLYFFRCIPLQLEVLRSTMSGYFVQAAEKESLIDNLKSALAQLTVVLSLKRFDPQELPLTIRNLVEDGTSQRQTSSEQSRLLELASDLVNNATDIIKNVEISLTQPAATNVETETSFNQPDDLIYLMP